MPDEATGSRAMSRERQVRVFISSTFRDMHAERDHLVTVVFPELRERVEQLRLEFFDVDLRWGVPAKDLNGETANSWEYCRQWIDRVEPFFVCILGQRYGHRPQPRELRDPAEQARQQAQQRSITELEVRHAVLNDRRKRRSYFYLRDTPVPVPPPAEERAIYNEFVDPPEQLVQLDALKADICGCGRPVRGYPCQWTGRGFADLEQFGSLVLDDLWSGVLRDERYVSKDVWCQVLGAEPDTDPRYTDESQPVPRELWEKIVALAKPPPKDPLDAERQQMEAFAISRLRWFQGRTRELQQLTDFIHSTEADAPRLAVLAAVPGQGKSALIAKLGQSIQEPKVRSQKPPFLITHFVGATERSATAHALVERLLGELDRSGIEWPADEQKEGEEPKRDFNSLCHRLAKRLGDYAGERMIVILLDALNQLTDGHDLVWLPHRLGPSVRVVVSCVDDSGSRTGVPPVSSDVPAPPTGGTPVPLVQSPEHRVLHALASRQPAPLRVPLAELTAENVRTIVEEYLHEYCKELDTPHVNAICALPQAKNPLYLLVMLGELRTLGGNDMNRIVGERIAALAHDYPDTVSLFRWVLQRLEVFGAEAVRWWCLYLAHGRVGMASHELAELLTRKLGADAAAAALRIERGLRRYLQRRGPQLDFFHSQLRQAVYEQYGPQAEAANAHADIATYFHDMADPERNQSWKGDNPRPFLEVAFHLAGAQCLDELCETLCDLRFVETRCRHGQVISLQADYRLAIERLPEAQAELTEQRHRDERLASWTAEIIGYARQWSERRNRSARGEAVTETEPTLPAPVASCRMWTAEEIAAECRRILDQPARRDRLRAFAGFVEAECYTLLRHGTRVGFVVQHAFNCGPGGLAHDAAKRLLSQCKAPVLLRRWPPDVSPNPRPALLRTLVDGSGWVHSVSVTPDGRRAVSGSGSTDRGDQDDTLRVWDLESGACQRTLTGHSGSVDSVSVTPDGRRAVSGSQDKSVRVWDLESGQCLRTLGGHSLEVASVSVTPDGRRAVSGSGDKSVRVWDLESGVCQRTLTGHSGVVKGVSVTLDGRRAVSASSDHTAKVWDLDSGKCLRTLTGHSGVVSGVSVTPDGGRAVSGSFDDTLRFWDLDSGQCLRTLKVHSAGVLSLSVTPDGRRAVTGGCDGTVRVWDLDSGQCLRTLAVPSGRVYSVSVTTDGWRAVSVSGNDTVCVWDLGGGLCLRTLEGHDDFVSSVSVTPDGRRAVSGSHDNTLRLWNLDSGQSLRTLTEHGDHHIEAVSVTPDGRHAVSGSSRSDTLRVWDLESAKCLRTFGDFYHRVHGLSVLTDGRRAVSGGMDETVRVWDLESGQCLRTLAGHSGTIWSVSVTPEGRRVVSGGGSMLVVSLAAWSNFALRVWDLESSQCLHTLGGHNLEVASVSVTPDGRRAVSGSWDKSVRVWDLESGQCLRTLEGHSDGVLSVIVTPDGRRVVSGSWDKSVRVWDLDSCQCLGVHSGAAPIASVALNGAGNVICAGTSTGEVLFLVLRGVAFGSTILTALNPQQARCPVCGQVFAPSPAVVAAIQDQSGLRIPDSAFLSPCPHCQHPLQFNPFFAADDDYYEKVLRRGLELSRREKGADHEETLAHLAALAAHFEQMGQPEPARPFAEEHARLTARKKAEQ